MTSPDATLVFVYGTLKRGGSNHLFLTAEVFVGEARTVPGFKLFNLGDYPGMVPSPDDRQGVTGEVWAVRPAALAQLDALEGVVEGLYRREPVALLAPFDGDRVETYLYNLGVIGRTEIASGAWTET